MHNTLTEKGLKILYNTDIVGGEKKEYFKDKAIISITNFRSKSQLENIVRGRKEELNENEYSVLISLWQSMEHNKRIIGFGRMDTKILDKVVELTGLPKRDVKDILLELDDRKIIDLLMEKKLKRENFNRQFIISPRSKYVYSNYDEVIKYLENHTYMFDEYIIL